LSGSRCVVTRVTRVTCHWLCSRGYESPHRADRPHCVVLLLAGDQGLHVLLLRPRERHRLAPHAPGYRPPQLGLEEEHVDEDEDQEVQGHEQEIVGVDPRSEVVKVVIKRGYCGI